MKRNSQIWTRIFQKFYLGNFNYSISEMRERERCNICAKHMNIIIEYEINHRHAFIHITETKKLFLRGYNFFQITELYLKLRRLYYLKYYVDYEVKLTFLLSHKHANNQRCIKIHTFKILTTSLHFNIFVSTGLCVMKIMS